MDLEMRDRGHAAGRDPARITDGSCAESARATRSSSSTEGATPSVRRVEKTCSYAMAAAAKSGIMPLASSWATVS